MRKVKNVSGILAGYRRSRIWKKLVGVLACVVVFVTTYALILPAITLESGVYCGKPEHTHSASCYTQVTSESSRELICTPERLGIHQHTEDCYAEDDPETPICGYADFVVHKHGDGCFDASGVQVCPLEEIEAHTHDESCYAIPEHTHTEACYTRERGELICALVEGEAAHTHSAEAGCYTDARQLTCGLEESQGHTHDEDCYAADGTLTCGLEQSDGHTHTDECYTVSPELTCEISAEPHSHTDDCYAWSDVLTCGLEEGPIQGAEPELVCEKPEIELHEHDEDCYETDEDGNTYLICDKVVVLEHEHTDECFTAQAVPVDATVKTCGQEESDAHTHSESCYDEEGNLICGKEETPGHRHMPQCYGTWELTCGLEEHAHSMACYSDPEADVETEEDWSAAAPELTGDWRQDLIAVAKSQLGYTESRENYTVDADGETIHGYTRYGAWYGDPYADWNRLFVQYCLNYAGIPEADFPRDTQSAAWVEKLAGRLEGYERFRLYRSAEDYIPEPGDLVFLGLDGDEAADRVAIVTAYTQEDTPASLTVIEGGVSGAVAEQTYPMEGMRILGYATLPENRTVEYTWSQDGLEITAAFAPDANLPENAQLVVERFTPDLPAPLSLLLEDNLSLRTSPQTGAEEDDLSFRASSQTGVEDDLSLRTSSQTGVEEDDLSFRASSQTGVGIPPVDATTTDTNAAIPQTDATSANTDAPTEENASDEEEDLSAQPTPQTDVEEDDLSLRTSSQTGVEEDDLSFRASSQTGVGIPPVDATTTDAATAIPPVDAATPETSPEEDTATPAADKCIDYFRAYLAVDGTPVEAQAPAEVSIRLQGEAYSDTSNIQLLQLTEDSEQTVPTAQDADGSLTANFTGPLAGDYAVMALAEDVPTPRAGTPVDPVALKEPHKTIDAFREGSDNPDTTLDDDSTLDKTDLYRLYLDMEVNPQTEPIDLLLVVDQSGSMHNNYGWAQQPPNSDNWVQVTIPDEDCDRDMKDYDNNDIFRDAALNLVLNGSSSSNGLVSQFLRADTGNMIAAVGFQGQGDEGTSYDIDANDDANAILDWTHTAGSSVQVEGKAWNATNYCAGLLEAQRKLEDPEIQNNGHKKVMIFLSDGIPTCHIEQQEGSYTHGGDGSKTSDATATATDTYYTNLLNANPDLVVHTVSINGGTAVDRLKTMATQGGGSCYSVTTAPELRKVLSELVYGTAYTEVKIEDTLSKYVDLYESQPDYKVTLKQADGTELTLYEKDPVTKEYKVTTHGEGILKSVTYDPATKKVSAEFYPSYSLAPGSKVTLSFNVKTNQHAYEEYAQNGYGPVKGDAYTNYGDNKTSSNQPGFHSNDVATVTYKKDDSTTPESREYPHPVVQAVDRELKVKKKWLAYDGSDITNTQSKVPSVEFKLYRTATQSAVPDVTVTVVAEKNGSQTIVDTRTCKAGSTATLTITKKTGTEWIILVPVPHGELSSIQVNGEAVSYTKNGDNFTCKFTVSQDSKVIISYTGDDPTGYNLSTLNPPQLQQTAPTEIYKGETDGSWTTVEPSASADGGQQGVWTLTKDNNWETVIKNLPTGGTVEQNGQRIEVKYTYEVKEVSVEGYETTYEESVNVDGGFAEGTITVQNRSTTPSTHELPHTGGAGTELYTLGGLLIISFAAFLLYSKKRGKEDKVSS